MRFIQTMTDDEIIQAVINAVLYVATILTNTINSGLGI